MVLTVGGLVGEQSRQPLVLVLLWQQRDGQVGPQPHRVVLLLLLDQDLPLRLQIKSVSQFHHSGQAKQTPVSDFL